MGVADRVKKFILILTTEWRLNVRKTDALPIQLQSSLLSINQVSFNSEY